MVNIARLPTNQKKNPPFISFRMIEKKTRINLGTSPEKSINGLERRKLKRKRFGKHRQERVAEEKLLFVFFFVSFVTHMGL